jgi:hypothetical protein
LTQLWRGNADNYPGAHTDGEADQRVAPAMAPALGRNPENALPLKGLVARCQSDHDACIRQGLNLASV